MLNVIDAVIILFLFAGAVLGFKKGAIQSLATLIGTIVVVVISYYLKNPFSVLLYTYLPFFKLNGAFSGITVVNILIYESIAFLIIFSILSIFLRVFLKVTGIISKIVDASIILTLPSKLLGILVGLIESYIFIFIFLFIFSQFQFSHEVMDESKFAPIILEKTPCTKAFRNTYQVYLEIKELNLLDSNKEVNNYKALDLLLKYKIITPENANKLIEKGKINIKGAKELIKKYS